MDKTVFNTVREMLHTASETRYTGIATVLGEDSVKTIHTQGLGKCEFRFENKYYFNDGVVVWSN